MQSFPLIAVLKESSGAAAPITIGLLGQNTILGVAMKMLPFWGKTIVTSTDFWPPLPILPLCCFIFQAFFGMPKIRQNWSQISWVFVCLPMLTEKFKSLMSTPIPATSVHTRTWHFLEENMSHIKFSQEYSKAMRWLNSSQGQVPNQSDIKTFISEWSKKCNMLMHNKCTFQNTTLFEKCTKLGHWISELI